MLLSSKGDYLDRCRVIAVIAAAFGLLNKLTTTGILGVLESVRTSPRLRVIVGGELALVAIAAAMLTYTHRWAAVAWEITGLCFAFVLLATVRRIQQSSAPVPLGQPPQITEQPTAGTGDSDAVVEAKAAQPAAATQAPPMSPESVLAEAGPPVRAIDCLAVPELGAPRSGDPAEPALVCMHAVARDGEEARPLAVCGYEYDRTDVGKAGPWEMMPNWSKCPKCRAALRKMR